MHDVGVEHQLCCAHALRELQGVTDSVSQDTDWCWATQATDALVALLKLVTEAITTGADTVSADALTEQLGLHRSAVQIGINQTVARSSQTMRKHSALGRRLRDRQATTSVSLGTGEYRRTTAARSATSA